MVLTYRQLFQLSVRHAFYSDGVSGDFIVEPTPACQAMLSAFGLLSRPAADGFTLVAPLDPDEMAETLLRPLGDDTLVFRFVLRMKNRHVLTVTDVDLPELGQEVFYFNNLREDIDSGRNHLGDSVDDARVGAPILFVARTTYTHTFDTPVSSATLTLTDLFGNVRETFSFAYAETVETYKVDLGAVDGLTPGRYLLDDGALQTAFYYDPGLFGHEVFGVIEIYNKTDTLTPDASDQVPAAYRFLVGNLLADGGDYTLQFEARSTTWQYVVERKYSDINIDLALLAIAGAIPFTKTTDTDSATFESDSEVAFSEARQSLNLQHNSTTIRALPNPGMTHVLQEGDTPGSFLSRMYINV